MSVPANSTAPVKVYTCPRCQSHQILVRFPVWITASVALNEDDPADPHDLVGELYESISASNSPLGWLCGDCSESGDGAPSAITEIDNPAA